jgi:hypothetical protein
MEIPPKVSSRLVDWSMFIVWVISCSCFNQSALRKGGPNRNTFFSTLSFVVLFETSWNFVIMFGY